MVKIYFERQMKNILLIVNNSTCFDKRFNGDFEIKNNILLKEKINNFKYTGCQIFNKELISHKQLNYFPISVRRILLKFSTDFIVIDLKISENTLD